MATWLVWMTCTAFASGEEATDDVEDIEPDEGATDEGEDGKKSKKKGEKGEEEAFGEEEKAPKAKDKRADAEPDDAEATDARKAEPRKVDAPAPAPAALPPPAPPGMAGHFQQGALLMLAVAVNDGEGARTLAESLADNKGAPSPLRAAAKEVAGKATDPEKAAPRVAALANTCAGCHLAGGRGPKPHDVDVVPADDPIQQHIMAAMFVWIGLVTPSDAPFRAGLTDLLPPIELASNERVRALGDDFGALAAKAKEVRSWDDRSEVFGRMLATCAACHAAAGVAAR